MTDDKLTEFIRTRIADDDAETLDTWLTGLQNWEQVVFMANAYEKSFTAAITRLRIAFRELGVMIVGSMPVIGDRYLRDYAARYDQHEDWREEWRS
jgi:hypothetical protein